MASRRGAFWQTDAGTPRPRRARARPRAGQPDAARTERQGLERPGSFELVNRIGFALPALEDRRFVDILNAALLAEDRGYELLLAPEAWGRDAMVVLGAIATRTSRIRIGTGIVNVYSRSPGCETSQQ